MHTSSLSDTFFYLYSPDSPYIDSIPSNVINNYWITKLSQSEEEEVNIYSSNMLVEELGKMRSASGNNKNDNDKSWIDVTFTARSPLLLSMFQYAVVTQKKSESPKKKETTPVVKLQSSASPMKKKKKKSVSETNKKVTTPVKEKKKSPAASNMTATERKQLDQMTCVDTIMAAARFRVSQAELALEFASTQVRSAMNELEDARAELNRAENMSIIVTAPRQGKTTG